MRSLLLSMRKSYLNNNMIATILLISADTGIVNGDSCLVLPAANLEMLRGSPGRNPENETSHGSLPAMPGQAWGAQH